MSHEEPTTAALAPTLPDAAIAPAPEEVARCGGSAPDASEQTGQMPAAAPRTPNRAGRATAPKPATLSAQIAARRRATRDRQDAAPAANVVAAPPPTKIVAPPPDRPPTADPAAPTREDPATAAAPTIAPRDRPARSRAVGAAPPRGFTRQRCLVVGGLVGLIAAVGIIFATTHSSPLLSPPASARIANQHRRIWIVLPGETLSTIAARASVDLGALERLNPGLVPTSVAAGQRLRLPS